MTYSISTLWSIFRLWDDIFFPWPRAIDELKQFEHFLNSQILNIEVTLTLNDNEMRFLVTTVFKHKENGISVLYIRVFFKETDTHQLPHRSSSHPTHTLKCLLKSQMLRFSRLSSYKTGFDWTCQALNIFSSLSFLSCTTREEQTRGFLYLESYWQQ